MAEQYTPATDDIRGKHATLAEWNRPGGASYKQAVEKHVGEFDRWLAAHDAQVLRDAADRVHAIHGGTSRASEYHHDYAEWLQDEATRIAGGTSHE